MNTTDIAGLKIDAITKQELLAALNERISLGQKTFLTTPYSEFLLAALRDPEVMRMLNAADIAVPDGIGLFWAKRFLQIPLTAKTYYAKIFQAIWQAKYSLAAIFFARNWITSAFPEKISGSDLIWDLAKFAADNNLSVYLLGGFGNTAELAAQKLKIQNSKLKISGISSKNPDDPAIIDDLKKAAPDLLLMAYGPIKQERWIVQNLPNLPVKLAVGLGGTFDYLAGKVPNPPQFLRVAGLEWLFRLITQPRRYRRILNATFGLATALIRYKVFMSMPYRSNVVSIVINKQGQVLLAKRNGRNPDLRSAGEPDPLKFQNYWQFSQGGINDGEDILQSAKRELKEELQITHIDYLKTSPSLNRYDWNNASRPLIGNQYRYRGQEQRVVYFRFTGNSNAEIRPDQIELTDYKWVNAEDLKAVTHPERWPLIEIVQNDLQSL